MYMYEKQTRACLLTIKGKNSTFRLLSSRFGPFLSLLCTRVSANIPSYKFSFVNSAALRCIGTDDTRSVGRERGKASKERKENLSRVIGTGHYPSPFLRRGEFRFCFIRRPTEETRFIMCDVDISYVVARNFYQ